MIRNTRVRKLMLFLIAAFTLAFAPYQKKDNTLTKAERKAGWILLFNGKDTDGWKGFRNREAKGWKVEQGELVCIPGNVGNRADLVTTAQYDNFELSFDWRIAPAGNSGVMYRVTETNGATYESGPEYSLIDDEGYPDHLTPRQKSGADYDVHAPSSLEAKPVGEYNNSRIVVNGAKVEHWLNGKKVVAFELWSPEWTAMKNNSKWRDVAPYAMAKSGHIALQDHGGGVWFKNIKLRKL